MLQLQPLKKAVTCGFLASSTLRKSMKRHCYVGWAKLRIMILKFSWSTCLNIIAEHCDLVESRIGSFSKVSMLETVRTTNFPHRSWREAGRGDTDEKSIRYKGEGKLLLVKPVWPPPPRAGHPPPHQVRAALGTLGHCPTYQWPMDPLFSPSILSGVYAWWFFLPETVRKRPKIEASISYIHMYIYLWNF